MSCDAVFHHAEGKHSSSPNCSRTVARSCSRRTFSYHSLFINMFFFEKIASKHTHLEEKQLQAWIASGCFSVGVKLVVALSFLPSDEGISEWPKQSEECSSQKITFSQSIFPAEQEPFLCFPWKEAASLQPLWPQASFQHLLPNIACKSTCPCLFLLVSKLCTADELVLQVNLL